MYHVDLKTLNDTTKLLDRIAKQDVLFNNDPKALKNKKDAQKLSKRIKDNYTKISTK